MQFNLYLITNQINGKLYIGATTKDVLRRWRIHINTANRGSKLILHAAIRKYGEGAFDVAHIASSKSAEDMYAAEIELIKQYNSFRPNGYNSTVGGDGCVGYRFSEEQKRWLSAIHIGQTVTAATRAKIATASRGRLHGDATKERMSVASIERWNKPEYQQRMKTAFERLSNSEEWKLKSKRRFLKQLESEKFQEIWKRGHTGFKNSPEAKERMRTARLNYLKMNPDSRGGKLTAELVRQIRQLLAEGYSQKALASQFGVRQTTISHIKTGKCWPQRERGNAPAAA